ncbi:MAG TPA: folylpolyglutamate synthase/dihydrofolate synthase family protein [Cytophagaceae bacterium]|nr:folylpolyglutamate synthase/dihydrofolate synthase family protein [Cytophagaceae bacterium]
MDYKQTIDFLFSSFPMFEKIGGGAYHPGLERIEELCEHFGNPQKKIKTIHIAGTNGKGSSSHLIASVLQSAGYKTGLYTSPHLKEFTERIKISGEEISKEAITDFVNQHLVFFKSFQASFFEITTLMAFYFFAQEDVDIAVIETGLGGRLDATNVLNPEVVLITNISFDHTQYLGNTLDKIAFEKAGIIKPGVSVVIGEKQKETSSVFEKVAKSKNAFLIYAEDFCKLEHVSFSGGKMKVDVALLNHPSLKEVEVGLGGFYQEKNIKGVTTVLELLKQKGWYISETHIRKGFSEVVERTNLKGRWYFLQQNPAVLCDTAHNEAGIKFITEQLKTLSYHNIYVVLGMVKDKEIEKILTLLPKEAWYFFTKPSIPRALETTVLFEKAQQAGLKGEVVETVAEALSKAKMKAGKDDLIYVGGSTFVVAEVL